ncbi:MAG: hypothetical protein FD171_857 [Actinobacteria bacterium]|nr:MAG: hypothetical protein FD171_857 [Actinomycetota bacterium]
MPYRLGHAFERLRLHAAATSGQLVSMPYRLGHAFELKDVLVFESGESILMSQCRIGWLVRSNSSRSETLPQPLSTRSLNAVSAGSCVRTRISEAPSMLLSLVSQCRIGWLVRSNMPLQRMTSRGCVVCLNAVSAGSCVRTLSFIYPGRWYRKHHPSANRRPRF